MEKMQPASNYCICRRTIEAVAVFAIQLPSDDNSIAYFNKTIISNMNKTGPIVVIEDDPDDQQVLVEIFEKLGYKNQILYFYDGNEALVFLNRTDTQPFLILSDINMPKLNGFELRNKVFTDQQLQTKCIPYLFFTTTANKQAVIDAYSMSVQGFFVKQSTMKALENTIRKIVEYWQECIAPSQFD
jgi:CheY-like chemotaxis protein